jgi:hypothetical protein
MRPMCDRAPASSMAHMLMTGSPPIDAERAFTRVLRSRRRAALARVLHLDAILEPTRAGGV